MPCELGEALALPAAPGPGRAFFPIARAQGITLLQAGSVSSPSWHLPL